MSTVLYHNESIFVLDIRPYDGTMFCIHADRDDNVIAVYDVVEDSEYGVCAVLVNGEVFDAIELNIGVNAAAPQSVYRMAIIAAIAAI